MRVLERGNSTQERRKFYLYFSLLAEKFFFFRIILLNWMQILKHSKERVEKIRKIREYECNAYLPCIE